MFLKTMKRGLLRAAACAGAFRFAGSSVWRQQRLLILCYHGISIEDEHLASPNLFMTVTAFEQRLRLLRKNRCCVLPLTEAIQQLYRGNLPPRAVALTFDDGNHDFYRNAYPLLKAYGYPATVYLTTWYCGRPQPVFDPACAYVLWKGRGMVLDGQIIHVPKRFDLRTSQGLNRAHLDLLSFACRRGLDGDGKEELLRNLAAAVGFDYSSLISNRLFHIMSPIEVRELAGAGVDFQLHTHRHRAPLERRLFCHEVHENRERIWELAGRKPVHFCYPSGIYKEQFRPWLVEESITSATTCVSALVSPSADYLVLPRIVDHSGLSPVEFESWLCGCGAFLPRRSRPL